MRRTSLMTYGTLFRDTRRLARVEDDPEHAIVLGRYQSTGVSPKLSQLTSLSAPCQSRISY